MISNVKADTVLLNKVLSIEKQPKKMGGSRIVYICKCLNCDNSVTIRKSDIKTHTGTCSSCCAKSRPFESIFNGIYRDHRKLQVDLTYAQYLEFTNQPNCTYCSVAIDWKPYKKTRAYFLDRIDNNLGYSKENCVVCCTRCNIARSNKFTYQEWYGMTEYFRKKEVKHDT